MRAVENALGITIPDNARIIRNLISGIQYVQDHVIHFYHLHALDWVDVVSALKADPAKTAALAQSLSDWPNASPWHFQTVQGKVKALAESGQLGIFANGYWGHPAYKLPPEANLMAVAHYLEALDWQKDVIRMHALLGGKNPHPQTFLVGGMSIPIDTSSQNALNAGSIALLRELSKKAHAFVEKVYIPDLLAVASFYKEWAGIGGGVGNYLSYGEFQNDNVSNTANCWLPRGFIRHKNLSKIEPVDQMKVTEDAAHAWYKYSEGDNKPLHPWVGETVPNYTGPKPPYEFLETEKKYSWVKGIRYDDLPTEVGPLSRMLVAYASGHKRIKEVIEGVLKKLNVGPAALFSTLGRTAARGVETLVTSEMMPAWIDELTVKIKGGDLRVHDGEKWDPSTWPKEARGYGFHEAPRGALCHWVVIQEGKVPNYQCVVPGGWNSSPRDAKGQRGPYEAALLDTPLSDPNRPLEILRTIHSFDPCMACAIHVVDSNRNELIKVRALQEEIMVQRIYIWEFPVRLVHWLNFLSILVLSFTGFYIGNPFLFVPPGEHFVFTTVKFIHMVAAYVFTVSCLIRLYWAFVGNEHGRVRVFFPFTRKRWKEVIEYMKFYLFMRKTLPYAPGHTASAALAYLGLFLLYLVEIVSGFSLYSQSHHGFLWTVMGGWLLSYISGPTLRLIHHFVMWLIFAFVILHLYIAWVNEIVGKDFVISSIFGGYKTPHEE